MKLIGVDVGGTFTDVVLFDSETNETAVHKVPTTSDDPSRGVMQGVLELCRSVAIDPGAITHVYHGTTIATNAVLEYKGARTGMITTKGYRDIIHIGRHQRPMHYSIMQEIPWQHHPLVRRAFRKVAAERLVPPRGEVRIPLAEDEVRTAARELARAGVEAVAVCFLFSYLNPAHEERAKEIVLEEFPQAFVTTSSSVVPQFREFERFTTTAMNAFIGPKVRHYVGQLVSAMRDAGLTSDLRIMRSNGGLATPQMVAELPVLTLLSGPAAGVLGGAWSGALSGRSKLITFDIGGTSADIGVVTDGRFSEASARDTWVGGYPVIVPMIDIHTIGAGGGSIAYVDSGGTFKVGPESAGSQPGPAAYGRGGARPTVTDANLVLGRLDEDNFLGGSMALDVAAARQGDRRTGQATRPRCAGSSRRRSHRRQQQYGECDPVADGAEGHRSARICAGRVRRRRPAARRGCRGDARHFRSDRSALSGDHVGDGAADHGHKIRVAAHRLSGQHRRGLRAAQS